MAKSTALKSDPAFQRLDQMRQNRQLHFRFTPRTAGITFMFLVAVPVALGYTMWQTEGLWSFRAKRRGDTIADR